MNGNLLFVGGDLSGIQKFIYNISSKKAMVSLKGRSQYLKDLTDDVCERILNIPEVGCTLANKSEMKIYCSGGKFYLQVPDNQTIRDKIDKIKFEVETELWKEHFGQLAINIAYIPFKYQGNQVVVGDETDNIGILWRKITEEFAVLKNQKFKKTIIDNYDDFFEVQKVGGDVRVCAITGLESSDCKFLDKDSDGDAIYVLDSVKQQIIKGQELRDKFKFKTLEQYACDSYLGVLRMDVDGLGTRFSKANSFKSMSDYKTFSGKLDKYFTEKLLDFQKSDDFKEFLNIVYAGGDDIFVVGKWDKVIEFAHKVRTEFSNNIQDKDLSISGGVAIVGAKFPIAKSAELAGLYEDKAKSFDLKGAKKNAFCMFGQTLSWNTEFDYVEQFKNIMFNLCQNDNMPRSILHKLMLFAEMKKRGDIKYIWHTAYYFKRFKEGKSLDVKNFCDEIQKELYNDNRKYDLLSISSRWAELQLREV